MDQDQDSRFSSIVSVIAFCGFGLLLVLTHPLWSPTAVTWLESLRGWLSADLVSSPSSQPTPATPAWSDAEIETALMECLNSVAPINADLAPIAPVRDGDCGTPAPVLLSNIGRQDKIIFDPPLLINCPMVVALHRWLNEAVQPAAKEVFGSPVARVIGSSYACRTVYNEPNGHLSQHAFANAVDLPIFVLADGRKVDVTHGWGPTKRDLIAGGKTSAVAKGISGQQKEPDSKNKVASTDLVKISTSQASKDVKQAQATAALADPPNSADAKFLRLVQQGACKIFSTVLGPEANDVHRTHLHLDLQDRNSVNICK